MSESYLSLSVSDRTEALETAADKSGRPSHLLEKDVWVVWTLSVLYDSPHHEHLTFKGGTSLSKAYHAIDRFSEDVDLTYDIRLLLSDLQIPKNGLPASRSQANKWTACLTLSVSLGTKYSFSITAKMTEISGRKHMALITCPDCNSECSDQAPACPKCGRPLAGQKSVMTKNLGFGGFVYALIIIGGLVLIVNGSPGGWILVGIGAILLFVRLKIWSGVERK